MSGAGFPRFASLFILFVPILIPALLSASPITYTFDANLADFTSTITTYGTFIGGSYDGVTGTLPYTPTTAGLLAGNYPRVVGGALAGGVSIDVHFGSATSTIVVFDDIDHVGNAWDVFQYKIQGSNDGTTFTSLFDPSSVNEANSPGNNVGFTLNAFTGTAPTLLNNSLTPVSGSNVGHDGTAGYEEYFTFGTAYSYYRFTPSTLTLTTGENETELAAVGIAVPSQAILNTATPEPSTMVIAALGLATLALRRRRSKTN